MGIGNFPGRLVCVRAAGAMEAPVPIGSPAARRSKQVDSAPPTKDVATPAPAFAEAGADRSLYRALFELLPSSVVLVDLDGHVRDANPAFCQRMGFTREEVVGAHVSRFSADAPGAIERNLARLRNGEVLEHEVVNRHKDGTLRHYEIRERTVDLPDGTRGILVVSNDITDRKAAEAERLELERARLRGQKLESLGILAGGIAHDFNNLLTVILGHLDLARHHVPQPSPVRHSLEEIGAAASRAADLTRQMLAYSGRGRFVAQPVHLGALVTETLQVLTLSASRNICIHLDIAEDLPGFEGDTPQIVQVLKSLLVNAAEAIPDHGGSIRVALRTVECTARELARSRTDTPIPPGRFVAMEVSDTGVGMGEEVLQKMFEPFFSTKFAGRGLGMAAVLGIVRGHNGALFVDSAPGRGTTVRVLFPVAEKRPETAAAAPRSKAPLPAPLSGKVLVAEDEDGIRLLMEKLLKGLGLEVVSAASGERALELFEQHRDTVTFALLDLTMPGISGIETLARLRELKPDLQAVLTSGYERDSIKGCQAEAGFIDFIQKPYTIATFRKAIESVCERLARARQ